MGFVKVYRTLGTPYAGTPVPPSDPVLLLATGGSVNLTLEPYTSTAIWGAGWFNAPEAAHYADGPVKYEGSVSVEWQGNANLWETVRQWAIYRRAFARSIDVSTDGNRIYQYWATGPDGATQAFDNKGAFCSSVSMSTAPGSLVTGDIGVVALSRTEDVSLGKPYIQQVTGVTTCAELAETFPLNPAGRNTDPIPFWRTNAQLLMGFTSTYEPFTGGTPVQSGLSVMDWSCERGNNQNIMYTCGGVREAKAVLMGAITASGNVTLFHPTGVLDPIIGPNPPGAGTLDNPYLYAQNTVFRVAIQGMQSDGVTPNMYYVELPAVMIESEDFGLKGQSEPTTRAFTMKGLGGRCVTSTGELMPPHLMSDPDEVY
jgi:hypothetical protein